MIKKVLTIAGSDCSGGAGVQADIKTITCLGKYAMSVITSLTAQNTIGIYGTIDIEPEFVKRQIDCVFNDIIPDSIKIGMVSNCGIIGAVSESLKCYNAENVVVDPVMVSTSGSSLIDKGAIYAMKGLLFPLASIVTPNIPEAEILSGIHITSNEDVETAAKIIFDNCGSPVLIKGGHNKSNANDLLYDGKEVRWFEFSRINNPNTHGTGCTLSSAVACGLADGRSLSDSVYLAKEYINGTLKSGLNLGKGNGPLYHNYKILSG